MLLFNGTTMNRSARDMVRAAMPADYRYVVVEFPGSGESSLPVGALEVVPLGHQVIQEGAAVVAELLQSQLSGLR